MNDYKISKEDLQVEQGEQREEITELKDFLFVACAVLACCCVGAVVIKRRYKLVPMQQPFITAPDGSEGPSGPAPPPPSTLHPPPRPSRGLTILVGELLHCATCRGRRRRRRRRLCAGHPPKSEEADGWLRPGCCADASTDQPVIGAATG